MATEKCLAHKSAQQMLAGKNKWIYCLIMFWRLNRIMKVVYLAQSAWNLLSNLSFTCLFIHLFMSMCQHSYHAVTYKLDAFALFCLIILPWKNSSTSSTLPSAATHLNAAGENYTPLLFGLYVELWPRNSSSLLSCPEIQVYFLGSFSLSQSS